MATDIYPGTLAYVELPQGRYTFDGYTITTTTEKADVTNFDRVAAKWLPGSTFGAVALSGPLTTDTAATPQGVGLIAGNEYSITFGLGGWDVDAGTADDTVTVTLTVLVESARVVQSVGGVARVEVSGVVNSDFLADADVQFLLDEPARV